MQLSCHLQGKVTFCKNQNMLHAYSSWQMKITNIPSPVHVISHTVDKFLFLLALLEILGFCDFKNIKRSGYLVGLNMFESTLVIFKFSIHQKCQSQKTDLLSQGAGPLVIHQVCQRSFLREKNTFKSEILELPNLQPHWKYRFRNINHTNIT